MLNLEKSMKLPRIQRVVAYSQLDSTALQLMCNVLEKK